ncbi:adenine-specific DNA-methyltransferase [Anaerobacterium chartisolvens]|uniref:Adenine-specific DNA-methyltransferase n=1 Tax=Anaerobacterium chartisolvens TaxID=1297424 RepID=A0A369BBK4_9FIRM|nr:site-specific DNA-methyltransferase [Anaerobacterium chartisolvens]RCX18909.1 adenine-specific DNA-methyltransferase [Anaerobacterium chartisolvens]
MDKMKMQTPNLADNNFAALAAMFPNAVTETVDENGVVVRAIDADVLAQEINTRVVSGKEERYQFTWPDKRKSVLLANAPIAAALRPCREESVDFDTTGNLYIEGDNLDVLKLLRETYLNRVKMIYIDPPYNTGNDFVYEDDFSEESSSFLRRDGQYDEQGNRLALNLDSNGRFHTDWLNMLYPRLRVARDLLTEDGVIFISIDDSEVHNLRKICDEIFGAGNFISNILWQKRTSPDARKVLSDGHEHILLYSKNSALINEALNYLSLEESDSNGYQNPDDDPRGPWRSTDFGAQGYRPNQMYKITTPNGKEYYPSEGRCWKNVEGVFLKLLADGRMWFGADGNGVPRKKVFLSEKEGKSIWTWWINSEVGHTQEATQALTSLLGSKTIFDYSKPVRLIKRMVELASKNDEIILDFFSGSATTAHSVMQLNAEDSDKRKFIMVQLPEVCSEDSEAAKAGYATICEIGKERIRRAGKKIKEDNRDKEGIENLDTGFRVLKLDSSNMKDVYYKPEEYAQMNFAIDGFMDNIKDDRTDEDLLFQVMLDFGIPLSAKIKQDGKMFNVDGNYLIAYFDKVDTNLITEIAKRQPYYAVFRDSSFISDSALANFEQVFNTYSPKTVRRVL